MVKIIKASIVFAMGFLFFSKANAIEIQQSASTTENEKAAYVMTGGNSADTDSRQNSSKDSDEKRESFFPQKSRSLSFSHFTWGAEAGSSLDLTSHDLSTFDVDVLIGYKDSFIKLAGIGAGIHRSIHTGNNFIPVYGVIRTSFRRKPSLLFMNLQAGYSFNTISDNGTLGDFTGALGLGINLQQTQKFKSYIILSAAYQYFSQANKEKIDIDSNYIFFARLVVGVNF